MSKSGKSKEKPKKAKGSGRRKRGAFSLRFLKWLAVAAIWCGFIGLCFVAWLAYDLPDLSRLTNAARRSRPARWLM